MKMDSTDAEVIDHYRILGLLGGIAGTEVTESEIRKAYRSLALQFHPDKNPNDPESTSKFLNIQTSYDFLSDPASRSAFDRLLRLRHDRHDSHESVLRSRQIFDEQHEKAYRESAKKRRKLRDDLDACERAFHAEEERKFEEQRIAGKLKEEVESLRARYAQAKKKSQPVVVNDYEARNKESEFKGLGESEKRKMIKVTWDYFDCDDYNTDKLKEIFESFGTVKDIVVRRNAAKNKGSAIVVMGSLDEVVAAATSHCGDLLNPLLVKPLLKSTNIYLPHQFVEDRNGCFGDGRPQQEVEGCKNDWGGVCGIGYQAFEDSVLQKMHKAAQKAASSVKHTQSR